MKYKGSRGQREYLRQQVAAQFPLYSNIYV